MKKILGLIVLMGFMGIMPIQPINTVSAQDSARVVLKVDARSFFVDNEYFGQRVEGYTLPGFRLTPRVQWNMSRRSRLEVGADWIHFWGAKNYPTRVLGFMPAYSDTGTALHIRPWVRAELELGQGTKLLMGCLSSNGGHLLPLPLYNPERQYATDAETGVQVLVDKKWLKADVWIDWYNFIWSHSPYQEGFIVGASTVGNIDITGDERWCIKPSLHFVGHHNGGQTLAVSQPVRNFFNLAAGIGVSHRPADGWSVGLNCHFMTFASNVSQNINSWGLYPEANLSWCDGRGSLSVGYLEGHYIFPILGSPLFSCASVRDDLPAGTSRIIDPTRVLTAGLRQSWDTFGDYCRLTLEGRLYSYFYPGHDPMAFSFGIFIDMSPTLTLLR